VLYPNFNELVAFKDLKSQLKLPSSKLVKSSIPGNHHSMFRGQGLEFDAVREYIPGDDIRNIDWRVTARLGFPHLKVFKEQQERHVALCVDMNATMRFGTRNTFKSIQAAQAAALIGWHAMAQQERVSAYLFGDVLNGIQFFPAKRTQKSFYSVLKTLATPPLHQHQVALNTILERINQTAHSGSLLFVISDFMNINDSFLKSTSIKHLKKKCDLIFISINDPFDHSICPMGLIKFSANNTEKLYVNTEYSKGQETYNEHWKENRQRLYEMTSRLRIPIIGLTTQSNISKDLGLELKKMTKRKKI
jgi:uncharacterized protein (DUF58 family)